MQEEEEVADFIPMVAEPEVVLQEARVAMQQMVLRLMVAVVELNQQVEQAVVHIPVIPEDWELEVMVILHLTQLDIQVVVAEDTMVVPEGRVVFLVVVDMVLQVAVALLM